MCSREQRRPERETLQLTTLEPLAEAIDGGQQEEEQQPQQQQEEEELDEDDDDDEEEQQTLFVPLTVDFMEQQRLLSSQKHHSRHASQRLLGRRSSKYSRSGRVSQIVRSLSRESDSNELTPDPYLEAGSKLPPKLRNVIPRQLIGVPLQDIDPYYRGKQTFILISRGLDLYRFSSTRALHLLGPFSVVRRVALTVLVSPFFSLLIIATILANCVIMAMPPSAALESTEIFFTTIYSMESGFKMVGRGFALAPFTYLRDPWNILDFVVIVFAYVQLGTDLGNVAVLRTFRVLRALKTVAIIPGLKTIVATVIESVKNLLDVIILTVFSLSVFALIGLQIYMGVLTQKCIRNYNASQLAVNDSAAGVQGPEVLNDTMWLEWNSRSSNWYVDELSPTGAYYLCGNKSGAAICPEGYTCLEGFGSNPNYGYTNFDTFGYALLASFRLMTQDYWENLYQMVIRTTGSLHVLFFVVAIFMNSYYLLNLILAIVAMSYDQLQQRVREEQAAEQEVIVERRQRQESRRQRQRLASIRRQSSVASAQVPGAAQDLGAAQGPGAGNLEANSPATTLSARDHSIEHPYTEHAPSQNRSLAKLTACDESCVEESSSKGYRQMSPVGADQISLTSAPSPTQSRQVGAASSSDGDQLSPRVSFASHASLNSHTESFSQQTALPVAGAEISSTEAAGWIEDDDPLNHETTDSTSNDLNGGSGNTNDKRKCRWRRKMQSRAATWLNILCVWDCCWVWRRFQSMLGSVIFDPFVELFITVCILLNTLFMAVDHYQMNDDLRDFLSRSNYFFTAMFTIEAVIKLIVLSPKFYFKEGWLVFDFIIVVLSLVDLLMENVPGIRASRLLRVFKLAKSWPTLNLLITIMGRTVGAIGNLTFVLCIIIFIFAVMGMQLFGEYYTTRVDQLIGGATPRWNFTDFMHSFMIVFRVLCGEWIESMWDCLRVAGSTCVPFFLATVVIANLVVLSLFLALLLSSFGASSLSAPPAGLAETSKLTEAFQRLSRGGAWCRRRVTSVLCCLHSAGGHEEEHSGSNQITSSDKSLANRSNSICTLTNQSNMATHRGAIANCEAEMDTSVVMTTESANRSHTNGPPPEAAEAVTKPVSTDCFPAPFYTWCTCCTYSEQTGIEGATSSTRMDRCCALFWRWWQRLRHRARQLTENNYFESAVIFMILLSSLALALEDVHLKHRPILQDVLYYMDRVFTVLFFLEMIIKWVAVGFNQYFRSAWCWLDFFIVMVSLINLAAVAMKIDGVSAFKTMRTLRALRPLRAMSRMAGMKVVVNALIQAIPSILNVFFVCLIFWLIFAIIGVQFFGGKFYECVDGNGTRLKVDIVPTRSECLANSNYTWQKALMTFDNVGAAYLSLFQVATFKGWTQIMADAVDSREVEQQPIYEYKIVRYLFFVFFIVCGAFFTLNLFIGVIIDNFNEQKRKPGASIELFMTEDQKKYYKAMKKMKKKKPQKAIPPPKLGVQHAIYNVCVDRKFDISIMVLIGINMMVMMLDEYRMSETKANILENFNLFFIVIFTIECILKLFAFRWYYFRDGWNTFDFLVIILSILGVVLKDIFTKIFNVPPTLLRVVRVAKVTRVLRLIRGAKGIRTLLFAFAMSAPALLNIIMLLFLMLFIYAIFGMSFFMDVKVPKGSLDATFNFQTFPQAFILLFQMMTSAGWDGVLEGLMNEDDCQNPDPTLGYPGNCGSRPLAVGYMISFLIISFLIVINMYIAVILENYSQAKEDVQEGLTDDDYDMYYEIWQRFDPEGKKVIKLEDLSELLDQLEPPLQISRPNKFKIVSMDIPICEGDRVWCVHILDALTRDFFARKGSDLDNEHIEAPIESFQLPPYKRISSTLWRSREDHCAFLIQKMWRHYARRRSVTEQDTINNSAEPEPYKLS